MFLIIILRRICGLLRRLNKSFKEKMCNLLRLVFNLAINVLIYAIIMGLYLDHSWFPASPVHMRTNTRSEDCCTWRRSYRGQVRIRWYLKDTQNNIQFLKTFWKIYNVWHILLLKSGGDALALYLSFALNGSLNNYIKAIEHSKEFNYNLLRWNIAIICNDYNVNKRLYFLLK